MRTSLILAVWLGVVVLGCDGGGGETGQTSAAGSGSTSVSSGGNGGMGGVGTGTWGLGGTAGSGSGGSTGGTGGSAGGSGGSTGGTGGSTGGTGGSAGSTGGSAGSTGGSTGGGSTGGSTGGSAGSTGGTGGSTGGGSAGGMGGTGGSGGAPLFCIPGSVEPCYTGPLGTQGVGACKAGTITCNPDGTAFGPCTGEVTPAAEVCATPADDDCDGQANEEGPDCACIPNAVLPCYTGPMGTLGAGVCAAGTATCDALGTTLGPCMGEILPAAETCATPADDDCDGQVNEGCVCVPGTTESCYGGPAGTVGVGACTAGTRTCNAQGTGFGACIGEVLPQAETCMTSADEDCDGQANEGCAAQTCALYQENFDDGTASPLTAGVYEIDWCDTYVPVASNTPLCMTGRTLRTNDSLIDPTIWVYKGDASCTSVRLNYTYYQFALANVNVSYQQSNDASEVCEKSGSFTSVTGHNVTQACTAQAQVTIPFGSSDGVYIRFDHGTGQNALWIDTLSLELVGCGC